MKYIKSIILSVLTMVFADISAQDFAPSSVLAEGKWIKVALGGKEDGVYEITYNQLYKLGFKNPDNVGVYGFGGHILDEAFSKKHYDDLPEVATYNDKNGKRILFYGQGLISWTFNKTKLNFSHTQNPYSTKACYFLHEKDSAALAMETISNGKASDETVSTFDAHLLHEQELVNIGRSGREMFGESFVINQSQTISFKEKLQPGTVKMTAYFVALSTSATSFDVKHGNEILGTAKMNTSASPYVFAVSTVLDCNYELETEENPSFRINFNSNTTVKSAYLNYIRLEGKQKLAIESGKSSILFRNIKSQSNLLQYEIDGYNPDILVWDVSDPINVKIQEVADGKFSATEKGMKEYALVDTKGKQFPGVNVLGEISNQNLHASEPVDMVIVTAVGLKTQAQRLADFRATNDGMTVKVVTDEEIYNEYSSGVADATAIRLYMKQMFAGRDGFLLLFGDGLYDNRKIDGNPNYLVCYETSSSLAETSSTVCDDYFGFLDNKEGGKTDSNGNYNINSDVVDIAIGRIPVHSVKAAEVVVDKIIAYSSNYHYGNWKNKLCFLSDDDKITDSSSDSPNAHMRHNDQIIDLLQKEQGHNEFVYQKIYLPAYTQTTTASGSDYPDAKKEFEETLRQGALLVNYAGHGATNSITHEMMMNSTRAAQLNMKNLPLWITASCDVSRWDDDDDSMGETLLLNSNGGAIALISTTRVVYAQQNLSLNLAVAHYLFKRKPDGTRYRLGEVMKETKQSLGSDYNKLNFCLLGDPAMTLSYPEYEMEITDVEYSDKVTVKGRVINPGNMETATDFNGLVYPTIYDEADSIIADKGLWQDPVYTFSARTRKIFSGRDVVRNGLFEFSFIVPKDAPAFTNDGLINLYACNENNDEANGYYENLIISRPESSTSDTEGPEIRKIFLNSADFKSGDAVGKTPYFYAEVHDVSGFNATGNSIGHDVTLTIKCTSNSILAIKQYNLNNYLTTFTGDPTTGNVRFTIPELDNGEYDLTFKIWDTMNNSSKETVHIVVDSSKPNYPLLVQAYPSPATQGEDVTFRILHNLPESPTTIKLQIYTQTGVKVLETKASTSAAETIFLKDGAKNVTEVNTALNADETSEFVGASTMKWRASVAPGIYIYKVYLSSEGSESTSESKLLMVKP